MLKNLFRFEKRLAALLLAAVLLSGCAKDKLRIGYATDDGVIVWGEIGQILERTDILKKNGIDAEIIRYKTTKDILPAIFRNDIDVALTATGVVMCSIVANQPVKLVSLLGGGGRNALLVSSKSGIKSVAGLRGKKVYDPIVGALLFRFMKEGGLKPGDLKRTMGYTYGDDINQDLLDGKWDAIMSWDPYFIELEKAGKIKVLANDPYHLEALMRDDVIKNRRRAALNFQVSLKQAVYFMLTNQELANNWFAEVSGLPAGRIAEALRHCQIHNETKGIASIDGFSLIGDDVKIQDIQNVVNAMKDYGIITELKQEFSARHGKPIVNDYETAGIKIRDFFAFELNAAADKKASGFDPSKVKIK